VYNYRFALVSGALQLLFSATYSDIVPRWHSHSYLRWSWSGDKRLQRA